MHVLSTFIIALREGLEAALIVGILRAYLTKSNRLHLRGALWAGVTAAVALSLGLGAILTFTSHELAPRSEAAFAGIISILAVVLVTAMVFWMKRTARTLGRELEGKVDNAVGLGVIAVAATAFFAVAREGLETALFLYTNFQTVRTSQAPTVGLILGLSAAVALGAMMYRKSITFNIGKFFQITGIALIVVAAGVLSHGIGDLQSIGWLPGLSSTAWDLESQLSSDSLLASLLAGTIGFSTLTTWLQIGFWATYVSATIFAYVTPISNLSQKVSSGATGR